MENSFDQKKLQNIEGLAQDERIRQMTLDWIQRSSDHNYTYNFTWMGRPVIQFPQDIIAMQELIWTVKPDLIIETGIAHGGSLGFYASKLELLGGDGKVVGIDIDIRSHNREAIEAHPMFKRISMIEGSSTDSAVIERVSCLAESAETVMVLLDSFHTHEHVLGELNAYAPLVTKGSYLVVFDTTIEDMPKHLFSDSPWGRGNNPKTAVHEFLKTNDRFEIDRQIQNKLLITVALDGYLKCVKD